MRTIINKLPLPDESEPEASGEFSVCQFFPGGAYEYVRRFVDGNEAVQAFIHYISSVGAKLGTTERVIITDGGDSIIMEWKHEEGIVFPPEMKGRFQKGIPS